jgi:multimeric flavodoxin WrbA
MKLLALSASPHAQGNSAFLLDECLRGARELGAQTERMDVSLMQIRGCQADYACKDTPGSGARGPQAAGLRRSRSAGGQWPP